MIEFVDLPQTVGNVETESSGDVNTTTTTATSENLMDLDDGGSESVQVKTEKVEKIPEQECHYYYSDDINVTMLILEDRLNITGI